jgi:hypothetical protein
MARSVSSPKDRSLVPATPRGTGIGATASIVAMVTAVHERGPGVCDRRLNRFIEGLPDPSGNDRTPCAVDRAAGVCATPIMM